MPLQNRVDPFGHILSIEERGTLMGNRGLLHNHHRQLVKPFQLKRWIICVLHFKNRQRQVMRPGHYTELFFKDEVSALTAGHRPCAECQREKFNAFKNSWSIGNNMEIHKIEELDKVLHEERILKKYSPQKLKSLPEGVFVLFKNQPHLWQNNKLYPWTFSKYGRAVSPSNHLYEVLTPPSTINALIAGYHPDYL